MSYFKEILIVQFQFRGKYDICKMIDLWCTSQAVEDPEVLSGRYFAVIDSISGIGTAMNEVLPQPVNGSIAFNNSKDSLAFQYRLSDLAAEYSLVGGCVKFHIGCLEYLDQESFEETLTELWSGNIVSVNVSTRQTGRSQKATIGISRQEKEFNVTKKIDAATYTDAEEKALGAYLPLVFGADQQVLPYGITASQDPLVGKGYVYATNFKKFDFGLNTEFTNRGITKYLAGDLDRKDNSDKVYREIKSVPDKLTTVSYGVNLSSPASGTQTNFHRILAYPLAYSPGVADPYYITGGRLRIIGNNRGTVEHPPGTFNDPKGSLTVRLLAQSDVRVRPRNFDNFLAEATIDKEDFGTKWSGNSDFWAYFVFDKFVPICDPDKHYWIAFAGNDEEQFLDTSATPPIVPNPSQTFVDRRDGSLHYPPTTDRWIDPKPIVDQALGDGSSFAWNRLDNKRVPLFELYGAEFTDAPTGFPTGPYSSPDSDGLNHSVVVMSYNTANGDNDNTGIIPNERFDVILEISGIEDDAAGDITGIPNSLLVQPQDIVELLFYKYDEINGWISGLFNDSLYANTHEQFFNPGKPYFRQFNGRTYSQSTNIDVIRSVCEASLSRLVYNGIGGEEYGLFAVGESGVPSKQFTDRNSTAERFFLGSIDTVVNNITVNFARRLDATHLQSTVDLDQAKDYSNTVNYSSKDGALGETLASKSFAIFGAKTKTLDTDWIKDLSSAQKLAELTLRIHDLPYELTQFVVDMCQHKDLRLFQYLSLESTEYPSNTGTNPRTDSPAVASPVSKNYLAEVFGINYQMDQTGNMSIKVMARLLVHENDPTYNYPGV